MINSEDIIAISGSVLKEDQRQIFRASVPVLEISNLIKKRILHPDLYKIEQGEGIQRFALNEYGHLKRAQAFARHLIEPDSSNKNIRLKYRPKLDSKSNSGAYTATQLRSFPSTGATIHSVQSYISEPHKTNIISVENSVDLSLSKKDESNINEHKLLALLKIWQPKGVAPFGIMYISLKNLHVDVNEVKNCNKCDLSADPVKFCNNSLHNAWSLADVTYQNQSDDPAEYFETGYSKLASVIDGYTTGFGTLIAEKENYLDWTKETPYGYPLDFIFPPEAIWGDKAAIEDDKRSMFYERNGCAKSLDVGYTKEIIIKKSMDADNITIDDILTQSVGSKPDSKKIAYHVGTILHKLFSETDSPLFEKITRPGTPKRDSELINYVTFSNTMTPTVKGLGEINLTSNETYLNFKNFWTSIEELIPNAFDKDDSTVARSHGLYTLNPLMENIVKLYFSTISSRTNKVLTVKEFVKILSQMEYEDKTEGSTERAHLWPNNPKFFDVNTWDNYVLKKDGDENNDDDYIDSFIASHGTGKKYFDQLHTKLCNSLDKVNATL